MCVERGIHEAGVRVGFAGELFLVVIWRLTGTAHFPYIMTFKIYNDRQGKRGTTSYQQTEEINDKVDDQANGPGSSEAVCEGARERVSEAVCEGVWGGCFEAGPKVFSRVSLAAFPENALEAD